MGYIFAFDHRHLGQLPAFSGFCLTDLAEFDRTLFWSLPFFDCVLDGQMRFVNAIAIWSIASIHRFGSGEFSISTAFSSDVSSQSVALHSDG
jgi:hypothetical protein